MLGGSLVCEQDWHKLMKTTTPTPTPPLRKGKGKKVRNFLLELNEIRIKI
jgi:hypothetical protein